MKKIISLSLALVMFAALLLPTTSFALSSTANVQIDKNFSDFTADNPHTLGGTDANSVLLLGANYGFYGNGTAATFTPEKGVFGNYITFGCTLKDNIIELLNKESILVYNFTETKNVTVNNKKYTLSGFGTVNVD